MRTILKIIAAPFILALIIAMFVLAFLVSPFGLPALGGWLVERLHGVKYAAMDFIAS